MQNLVELNPEKFPLLNQLNDIDLVPPKILKRTLQLAKATIKAEGRDAGTTSTSELTSIAENFRSLHKFYFRPGVSNLKFRSIFTYVFNEVAFQNHDLEESFIVGGKAMEFAARSEEILEARKIIRSDLGIDAAQQVFHLAQISDDRICLEMFAYAWNKGRPKCPHVFGSLLAATHQKGRVGSLVISVYSPSTAEKMFRLASKESLEFGREHPTNNQSTTLYRGGYSDSSAELASGMCWTDNIEIAAWFATRKIKDGTAFLLSTKASDNEVLARFDYENEVLLSPDENRLYEIIKLDQSSANITGTE